MNPNDMITIGEIQLESDPQRGNMVVLKQEAGSDYYFLMFVGDAEFSAIAREKGLVAPKRPLTHEVYLKILERVQIEFLRTEIYDVKEDTFYANVVFRTGEEDHRIDSRPSDAVVLALNRKIPILVRKGLFHRKLTPEEIKEYEGFVKSVKF
jgi:uncharacterized protein